MIASEFPATAQAVFDHCAQHLIEQGKQSRFADDLSAGCAYRGSGGEACAVGCLIPDAYYTREIEGLSVGDILLREAEYLGPLWVFIERHAALLNNLQIVHDEDATARWRQELRLVADRFGLSAAILDTLPPGPAEGGPRCPVTR